MSVITLSRLFYISLLKNYSLKKCCVELVLGHNRDHVHVPNRFSMSCGEKGVWKNQRLQWQGGICCSGIQECLVKYIWKMNFHFVGAFVPVEIRPLSPSLAPVISDWGISLGSVSCEGQGHISCVLLA